MDKRTLFSKIDKWTAAHREEFVRDLASLIAIPSVANYEDVHYPMGYECKRAAVQFAELGKKYGFAIENDAYYTVSVLSNARSSVPEELGMLGHLDVVPAGEGWKTPPFSAVERDGYIFGRGSNDNKGPLLMCLYVMRCMNELNIATKHSIRLIAGCDEEARMSDMKHYLHMHTPPVFTLNCDGAWAFCIAEKGILTADLVQKTPPESIIEIEGGTSSNTLPDKASVLLRVQDHQKRKIFLANYPDVAEEVSNDSLRITVKGRKAHSSTPSKGENAISKLLNVLCVSNLLDDETAQQIRQLSSCFEDNYGTALRLQHTDELSGQTTCVPTMIRLLNGEIHLHVNIRYAVTQRSEILIRTLNAQCERKGISVQNIHNLEPRSECPDKPVIKLLLNTCKEVLGKRFKPYVSGGGTYSRIFPNSIPYGPCLLNTGKQTKHGEPHAANEAVSINQLMQGLKVYVIALLELDEYFTRKKENENSCT